MHSPGPPDTTCPNGKPSDENQRKVNPKMVTPRKLTFPGWEEIVIVRAEVHERGSQRSMAVFSQR